MATTAEINSFIELLGGLAVNETKRRIANGEGFVVPSVCIAQSAMETGYGTAPLMIKANAFFGIKAGSSWTGKVFVASTYEVAENGVEYDTVATFRAYDNLEDSVRDYYDLIVNNSRYAGGVSHYPDDVKTAYDTLYAIWSGGYATETDYVGEVYNIITRRELTQFDEQIGGEYTPTAPNQVNTPYYPPVTVSESEAVKFIFDKIGTKTLN